LPVTLEKALCVGLSAFQSHPSKAVYSRRSGLNAALSSHPRRLDNSILIVNGAESYWVADAYGDKAAHCVLICHNIESDLYSEQLDSLGSVPRFIMRSVLRDDKKLQRLESRAFEQSDLVICISNEDAAYIETHYGGTPTLHLPPVFDYEPFVPQRQKVGEPGGPLRLGFLAKFSWWPNNEAALWLTREIMPLLPIDRELHLFGLGSNRFHSPQARVFAHGFVDDLSVVWDTCDILLCPMRHGGGVNVKFAEALYNRVPVCATPLAARGLGVECGDVHGVKFLGDSHEWVTFLGSDAARAFAARPVLAALGEKFALPGQVVPLRDAFDRL
jgi:hypothetical protein